MDEKMAGYWACVWAGWRAERWEKWACSMVGSKGEKTAARSDGWDLKMVDWKAEQKAFLLVAMLAVLMVAKLAVAKDHWRVGQWVLIPPKS